MAIDIIGAEDAASSVIGAGAKVFEGKFGLFGKYNSAIQPGTYVITSTTGSSGSSTIDIKKNTSGKTFTSNAGQVIVDTVSSAESGFLLAARPARNVYTAYEKLNDPILPTANPTYTSSTSQKTFLVASSPTTTVVAVHQYAYTSNNTYWQFSLWTSVSGGTWTRTHSVESVSSSGQGPEPRDLVYSGGRFIVVRRPTSSSILSNYPNVFLESTDGITWTTVTPAAPYGGTGSDDHYCRVVARVGSTYFVRANNNNFLASSTDLTNFTDVESSISPIFSTFLSGIPEGFGVDGNTIVVTAWSGSSTSATSRSILYSTDRGVTWQFPTTVPANYRYLTNPIKVGTTWYIGGYNTADNYYDFLKSTDLVTWTTYDPGTNVGAVNQLHRKLYVLKGATGFALGGEDTRYAAWTTQSTPETTSWSSGSGSTPSGNYMMYLRSNIWAAGGSNSFLVNLQSVPNPNNWGSLAIGSINGATWSSNWDGYAFACKESSAQSVYAGRGYDGSSWRNYYLWTNSTSPNSTSNWQRYFSPIGTTSSQTPHVTFLNTANLFLMSNASTREFATSPDGLTWTVRSGSFPGSAQYYGVGNGNAQALTSNSFDLMPLTENGKIFAETADGITVTTIDTTMPFSKPIAQKAIGVGTGAYITVSSGHVVSTTNGTTWTVSQPFVSTPTLFEVNGEVWGKGTFGNGTVWRRTSDNVTWTTVSQLPSSFNNVGRTNGKYVAVGSTLQSLAFSSNGTDWDTMTAAQSQTRFAVTNAVVASNNSGVVVTTRDTSTLNEPGGFSTFSTDEQYGVAYFNSTFTDL